MPTLNDITEGHSKRITRITKVRDERLRDAVDARDRALRAMPAAAGFYDAFDAELSKSRQTQLVTDGKAEAARAGALQQVADSLSDALTDAQQARRHADVAAFERRRKAEEDAEHEFILAIAGAPAAPTSQQAQKIRAEKLEKARKEFDAALAAAQEQFRQSRDAALIAESRGSRDAERAFTHATKVSDASAKAARAAAEQALAKSLATVPQAAAAVTEWKKKTAAILADYKRSENEEFQRFHEEVQALKG
jgi:hypothetical protein